MFESRSHRELLDHIVDRHAGFQVSKTTDTGVRVGRVLGRFKMGKHFRYEITDHGFDYQRDEAHIAAEALLDGLYVMLGVRL